MQTKYQLCFSEGYTHDFVVTLCINKIGIANYFYQLAIIDFRNQNLIKIFNQLPQVTRKRTYITKMRMTHCITLRLQFSNGKVALDVETGNAGEAAKLIGALLGPTYVKDKALAGIVINLLDQKYSTDTIAKLGIATPMFLGMAGSSSNTNFVMQVFTNVVGRAPTPSESSTYVNMLDAGTSQSALALMAAHTDLNAARINLVGLIQHGLEFA